jgi:hypothetical protein
VFKNKNLPKTGESSIVNSSEAFGMLMERDTAL